MVNNGRENIGDTAVSDSDSDSNDENFGQANADSDMYGPATIGHTLIDPRILDLAEGLQEAAGNEEEVVVADNNLTSAQFGPIKRHVARNKNNPHVWWALPSESEEQRTAAAEQKRKQHSLPIVKQTFDSKANTFKCLLTPNIISNVVFETNRKTWRFYQSCTTPNARK